MATPGFDDESFLKFAYNFGIKEGRELKTYKSEAAQYRPSVYEQDSAAESSSGVSLQNWRALAKFGALMTHYAAGEAVAQLGPQTHWSDIVGGKDAVTRWTDHLAALRNRNAQFPRSSDQYVMTEETHSVGVHRPAMAEVVALTLDRGQRAAK
jgi:hypothetical protein